MNSDPYQAVSAQLDAGEEILWAGMPRQGVFLRPSDLYLIPFSLMWGGFAILWECMALFLIPVHTKNGVEIGMMRWIFPLWGIPFVAAGLYMIFGRFFVDAKQRAKTFYGVTNRRVIIISGSINREVKSLYPQNLSEVSISEKENGTGTITFGAQLFFLFGMRGGFTPWGRSRMAPAFDSIPKAKEVLKMVQQLQRQKNQE